MVSNSHREHLLRPCPAILMSSIDNNPENNGISQGMCFPPLAPARPIFPIQSSKTSNSSGRMLCNEQPVFEKVQDNDSTKNAIFESNIFPFTHESIMLFYFVTIYKPSSDGSKFIWQKINVLNIQDTCVFLFLTLWI